MTTPSVKIPGAQAEAERGAAVRVERLVRRFRVHRSVSKLKSTLAKESRQLDVNLGHALAPDRMALRHVAAKRVRWHKAQLQTYWRRTRFQHLEQTSIGDSFFAARKDRLNLLNRLV